jgi:hypothetical protein
MKKRVRRVEQEKGMAIGIREGEINSAHACVFWNL